MEWNKLEWNEEYFITAEKDTDFGLKRIKTPKGQGFITRFQSENELKRLESCGYKNIRISVRKWTK